MNENIIAIGRSRYLSESIRYLSARGYRFKAIISDENNKEYDVSVNDFKELAEDTGASFFITKTLDKKEILEVIIENNVQVGISANWQYKVPEKVLQAFKLGILNFHLGNLPDYKGNATVNWSIINGENHIYANIHKMDPVLDAGDIVFRKLIPITSETYIQDIIKKAEDEAPRMFEIGLDRILKDPEYFEIKGSVYGLRCYSRLPEDSQINWQLSNVIIHKIIRASSFPYSGAYSFINGQKVIFWKAKLPDNNSKFLAVPGHIVEIDKSNSTILVACGEGLLEIQEIEIDGQRFLPSGVFRSVRERFKFLANA